MVETDSCVKVDEMDFFPDIYVFIHLFEVMVPQHIFNTTLHKLSFGTFCSWLFIDIPTNKCSVSFLIKNGLVLVQTCL